MGWVKRLLATLLVLVVITIVFVVFYAQRVLPVQDGAIKLTGAMGPIHIGRDEHGIPSIKAGSLRDLAFGLGVVHAQDRLWQLETLKRIGAGRMAEAFGDAALEGDRFLRALGVRRAAAAQWAQTQGEARELLLAYANGINAVVREQMVPGRRSLCCWASA